MVSINCGMPVAGGQAPLELVFVLGDTVDAAYGNFFVIASTGRLLPPSVAGTCNRQAVSPPKLNFHFNRVGF